MKGKSNTPMKLRTIMLVLILGTIVSLGINFLIYSASSNTAQVIGKDTVPSIIGANHINALLADAHSNAMNAMVTKEKSGGKFWAKYRKDMQDLHSELLDISNNITFGEPERKSILAIMANVSAYEYTLGGAVSNGAEISVDQFGEANRLMQQKILPASVVLNKVYAAYLDSTYNSYTSSINISVILMIAIGVILLVFMLFVQYFLFKKTHRLINIGLALSTLLLVINIAYSANAMNSVKSDIVSSKDKAFNSIEALWSAKATAYNANALESLYLLHNGTGIVQTADNINFDLSASRICSSPKEALNGGKFEGYLSDELSIADFDEEKAAVTKALKDWAKYVDINLQVRKLEYDSKHEQAIALNVGGSDGQSDYEFNQFDAELNKAIDINQTYFNSNMDSVYKTLNLFPYMTLASLVLIILLCILGLKPRMEEYKA